ncbi:hypothetical protein Afil01_40390 [Actinorhabdospora filicis]|uniref:Uncharacterized protein n=1 Tax=Actinorhabdospora filicis TaxID=1785913 RepID=A0A9W6SNZ0_9ACTN|nr:GTPase-associated protein 1-related protein [Actinorhabdospora filicis]GLZ79232.1 hypothetical protein Afil01_40390 [Actinorhabdospora filicis]
MTGRLESLVYTDCLPGRSLTGQAGFGFQTATPGAGAEARALTRDHLLYEPPAEWMRQGRPVADYPVSLAYVHADGWYATASGIYLGKEAKGERQGNHLTHAVLTRDPAAYDLIRPAQLAGAGFWRAAPGGDAPEVGPNWEPGDLDADTVAARVSPGPLGAMLAALTGGEERVVLVGEDAREVLTWIAAVTLLLPQRTALDTGFKVFTTRPSHGAHRLVGVHPDWFGEPPPGVHVFDLRDGTHTPVADDEVSALWARLFCAEDALDVVDAVELAAQCCQGSDGLDVPAAQALACAAFFGHVPPMRHAPALIAWLRDSDDDRYRAYGRGVTDALMRLPDLPYEILSALHDLAVTGRLAEEAATIRLALLEEECRDTAVRPGTLRALPDEVWRHDDEARERLTEHLREADPARFHRLLRVRARFGVPCDPLRDAPAAAMEFLDWWSQRPALRPDPGELDAGLRERLADLLGDRCAEDDDEAARIGAEWASWLLRQRPETSDHPFFLACLGASMRTAPAELRARRARRHLAAASPAILPAVAAALWRWRSPQREDIAAMLPALPPGTVLDPALFAAFRARLLARDSTLDVLDIDIAEALLGKGLLDDDVRALVADAAELAALRVPRGQDGLVAVASRLGHLHEYAPQLLRLHGRVVLAVLLNRSLPATATLVVPDLAPAERDAYAAELARRLREPSGAILYCAYMVVRGGHASPEAEARLTVALRKAVRAAPDALIARATEVAASVRATWRDAWTAHVEQVRRGGITRLWRGSRGAGG